MRVHGFSPHNSIPGRNLIIPLIMSTPNQKAPGKKENSKPEKTSKASSKKQSLGDDYWDRVADDVASGYEGKDDIDDILNTDQEADDHIRGDEGQAS